MRRFREIIVGFVELSLVTKECFPGFVPTFELKTAAAAPSDERFPGVHNASMTQIASQSHAIAGSGPSEEQSQRANENRQLY